MAVSFKLTGIRFEYLIGSIRNINRSSTNSGMHRQADRPDQLVTIAVKLQNRSLPDSRPTPIAGTSNMAAMAIRRPANPRKRSHDVRQSVIKSGPGGRIRWRWQALTVFAERRDFLLMRRRRRAWMLKRTTINDASSWTNQAIHEMSVIARLTHYPTLGVVTVVYNYFLFAEFDQTIPGRNVFN